MKVLNNSVKTLIASSLCAALIGCGGDNDSNANTLANDEAKLNLTFTALDDLGEDYVYEGWIIVNGSPVSTGRFTSSTSDVQSAGVEQIEAATKYVLTIEPAVDDEPGPAATHVLAGDIINSAASLSIADGAALGTDFSNSTGSFILETPSSAATDDYDQGLWWLIPGAGPGAGLSLPTLPEGWVYEGWVASADGPVSTGTFTNVAAADSDAAGPTSGSAGSPPFPGQDFINPTVSLIGMTAVISVEPQPDNSPAPFGIKPLIDMVIENVGAGQSQDMANVITDNQPSGSLTIELSANR